MSFMSPAMRRVIASLPDCLSSTASIASKSAGKTPYRLLEQPRYRAGWDFLRLRAQSGEIPMELPDWWDAFADANPDARETMLVPDKAGTAKKRRRRKKPAADAAPAAE